MLGGVLRILRLHRGLGSLRLSLIHISPAQIHGDVVNLAADHPHQLALRVFLLKMKASEHTLFRLALVVLDKHHIQAGGFKIVIIIGLHEIASVVAEHLRLYHDKAFDLSLIHILSGLTIS